MRTYRYAPLAHSFPHDAPATRDPDALLAFSRAVLRQFRQESGHYYWQILVAEDPARLRSWREVFGDERRDYAEAMRAHYHAGPPANWREDYVSPYASAHPWEDFAETWAHYLYVLSLVATTDVRRAIEPARGWEALALGTVAARDAGFRALLRRCLPAMLRARRKRRGHGTGDPRPLAPSPTVMRKLAWVHRLVLDALAGMQALREPRLAWDPR